MIFREPTHELLDSSFQLCNGHVDKGDALLRFGPDLWVEASLEPEESENPSDWDTGDWDQHGDREDRASREPGDVASKSHSEFVAMLEQIQRELSEDPFHAGHCLFAHIALRGLLFADPTRALRLLRSEPGKLTRGATFYGSRIAPHVAATTLFRSREVHVEPLDLPGWTGALIVMPPPTQPSGVHFAAALIPVGIPAGVPGHLARARFEYITLEESVELTATSSTTLGRRLPNEKYIEVGPGPAVNQVAFLEAVQAILRTPRKLGTPTAPTITSASGEAPHRNPSLT